jgi:hypothetical protein
MTTYDTYLLEQLNKRNNKEPLDAVIGTIISINPITVSLFGGKATFTEGTNCYVCKSLKSYTGTIVIDGTAKSFAITRELTIDDDVLCIPLSKGQKYAIIDKV